MTSLKEIRARAEAASPGPWTWRGNVDTRSIYLTFNQPGLGWNSIMDFARWGMQSARPRFLIEKFFMKDADDLAVFEVCRTATTRADRRVYRGDIVGFRHPDAEFIAAARQDVDDLLSMIAAARIRAEEWIENQLANSEPCTEGVGCPCCHALEVLEALGGAE